MSVSGIFKIDGSSYGGCVLEERGRGVVVSSWVSPGVFVLRGLESPHRSALYRRKSRCEALTSSPLESVILGQTLARASAE